MTNRAMYPKRLLLMFYDEADLKRVVGDPIPEYVCFMPGTRLKRKPEADTIARRMKHDPIFRHEIESIH